MAAGTPMKRLLAIKRRLEKKHGIPYTIIRASNGEAAVLPTRDVEATRERMNSWRNGGDES